MVCLFGIFTCLALTWPFVGAITWAVALAILFMPLHAKIEKRLRRPNLAAFVSVATVIILVIVPMAFVVERLIAEAASGAVLIQARVAGGELQRLLDRYPSISPLGVWINSQFDLPSLMAGLASWLSNIGAIFVRGSILQVVELLLTFYILFYFLRDRLVANLLMREWLPLSPVQADELFRRVSDTVHATVYGTLAVATVQGLLGGLMFWFLGLSTPLLWGVVMGLLSVVPVLGAFIIWIPAAILLLLDGSWASALILALWGGIVVGSIDNILRPIFVGNRLQLHTIPSFISIIGGLVLFGAPGFILGPLAVTVTLLFVKFWSQQIKSNDAPSAPEL